MANIYYKTNNGYSLLTYADIGAAAEQHTHLISDIHMPNFKHNGCMGQNILQLYDGNCKDLLFYVPKIQSNIVYGKKIPSTIIDAHPVVPAYNTNKIFNQTNTTGTATTINTPRTTAYEYNGIGHFLLEDITWSESEYCYYYPLNIKYNTFASGNIVLSFQTNITQNNICKIIITPKTKLDNDPVSIAQIAKYTIETDIGFLDNETWITSELAENIKLGLIVGQQDIIYGICIIILNNDTYQQIEITNINITANALLNISQRYIDYYDISDIPSTEISGSLGPVIYNQTNYNQTYENDMVRYYRSYKFYNLLTWGQSISMYYIVIPGYCNSTNYNQGYFICDFPYEFDQDIGTNDINLSATAGVSYIWAWGGYAASACDLIKGTSNTSGKINYKIDKISPGRMYINFYFPAALSSDSNKNYISFFTPLKFIVNGTFTISVAAFS